MLQSNYWISPRNGELVDMGGPCRIVVGQEAGNNVTNKDLSPIDDKAAAKSLSLYEKPYELYQTIRQRFEKRPVFLQRCLNYKIQALRQRRLKATIQLKGLENIPCLSQWYCRRGRKEPGPSTPATPQYLPMFVMVSSQPNSQQEMYSLSNVIKVAKVPLVDNGALSAPVTFLIPHLAKLCVLAKNGHLILFFTFVDRADLFHTDSGKLKDLEDCSGRVVWGKLSMASLCRQWLKNADGGASLIGLNGASVETVCSLDFAHSKLQHQDTALGRMMCMQPLWELSMKLQVCAHAVEIRHAHVNGRTSNGSSHKRISSSPSQALRNPLGNVEFHFRWYFNRFEKREVTEGFSCPFCSVRCYTFKGLRCHLHCTHDLFNFEYLPNADVPIVNVTVRTELLGPEGDILDSDPTLRTKSWAFWSLRPFPKICGSKPKVQPLRGAGGYIPGPISQDLAPGVADPGPGKSSHDDTHMIQKQAMKGETRDGRSPCLSPLKRQKLEGSDFAEKADFRTGVCATASAAPPDETGALLTTATSFRLRPEKNRHGAAERAEKAEARNRLLLQKRTFFHSHTAQPMGFEELISDRDSEDELDEDLATVEDRRMLEDFVDVTAEEKDIMHLWNSFVRKKKVIADGHCSWACEAFSVLHAAKFSSQPSLRRCFMLFLIKLWNHHLVDGATFDKCLKVVDSYAQPTNLK
ncbi:polycomb group protein EMBRYONIC FLOWER 2 isoform X2 [Physcomitrium patens]|uniref:polycomb group protein EMBRYONIC FLOWER 2 isoform X2 n=1 Tax=Physcomitrium patens TaxID=3218 RepID=UPI000D17382A|nr:polycomb group protein EMBRYONIC FLOWER 2-like isoform X2 [Physcomitrium patens]|eukprot:XP_024378745.1 polycomb group protein EMBRYONIC FLOWER 2-like isoform X2 [Physcomitrella patens]